MGDVGTARVVVEADTGLADAAFKKLQADAARAMDAIGRQSASAKVDMDKRPFERGAAEIESEMAALNKEKVEIEVKTTRTAEDKKALNDLRKSLKELGAQKKSIGAEKGLFDQDANSLKDLNKQRDISARKQAQMSKNYLTEQKAIEANAKAAERAAAQRARAAEQEERQVRQMGLMQGRAAEEDAKRTEQGLKDVERLSKARKDYGKVLGDLQRLETKTGRPGGIFRSGSETRDLDVAKSKVEGLAREIEHLGGSVDDIDPSMEKNQGVLSRWVSGLSGVAVRVGPITASLKQLVAGAVVLGPVLTGLLGGLTSVVGVLGAGLAGAGAVGAAGFAGFAASAVGVGLVIKPLVSQFSEAKKASEALSKAEIKYGKNSKQVKTAQEQLNHTLAGVSPVARSAFKSYGQIGTEWANLTKTAKPAVFNAFGQGLKTVQDLLPEFAKESVATTKVAGKAFEGWVKSLRSSEAKKLLGEVMSNFRGSIPGVASGLASISAAFGRITASASKLLPGLSKGFAGWANGIEKSVGGGKDLDATISRLVGDMQDIGHLAQSSGSLLVHLFDTSSESGDDLVQTLTHVTERWDNFVQSASGQRSLKNFFSESAEETKEFFSVLGGLVKILFQIGRAGAPISAGFLKVITVIGNLVSAATELVPLKGILEGVGGALAAIWVKNKATALATGIQDVARALYTMAAGEEAVTAAQSTTAGGLLLGKSGVKTAAKDAETLGAEAAVTGGALEETAGSAGLLSAALAPEVLIPAGAIGALVYLATTLEGPKSAFEEAAEAAATARKKFHQGISGFVKDGSEYNKVLGSEAGLNKVAAAAREGLVTAQKKYGAVSKEALAAQEKLSKVESEQTATAYKAGLSRTQQVAQARDIVKAANEEVHAREKGVHAVKEANQSIANGSADNNTAFGNPNEAAQVAFAVHKLSLARAEAAAAAAKMVVANIPLMRQQKELSPLTEANVTGLRKLSQTIGAAATKKIGSFVRPQDVAEITKLGNKLTGLGRGPEVKSISVKSQGADQTIAKLNRLQKQTAKVEGARASVKVDANDTGAQRTLKAVTRESQRLTGSKATIHILGNADNAEQAITRLLSHLHSVLNNNYKAELKAEDKSGAAASAFHHNLQRAATGKYQAKLTAVNQAANIANKAEQEAKKFSSGHYQAKLTAVNQAAPIISAAIAELEAYNGKTAKSTITTEHVTVNTTRGGGHYAGGPSTYGNYAMGATSLEIERARARAEKETLKDGRGGGVIRKPTMLVGEQSPTYNEYVITENPAFRTSNRRYVTEAAGSLGMETVPAYAKGKGSNKKGGKSGGGVQDRAEKQTEIKDPGPPPSLKAWTHNHKLPTTVNHGHGIALFNKLEGEISVTEGAYQAELSKEEREVQIYKNTKGKGGRAAWDFAKFKKWRKEMVGDEKSIVNKAIPQEIKDVGKVQKHAENVWATANGREETAKGKLHSAKGLLAKEENIYKHMHQSKHENSHEFSNKKLKYKAEIEEEKHTVEKWEAQIKIFQEKKQAAKALENEAKKEIDTLKGEGGPTAQNALAEQGNELSTLEAIETGELEAPYAEPEEPAQSPAEIQKEAEENARNGLEAKIVEEEIAGPSATIPLKEARERLLEYDEGALGRARLTPETADDLEALNNIKSDKSALEEDAAGGTEKSIGEETASYNSARQSLYEQFASNITNGAAVGSAAAAAMASSGFAAAGISGLGARTTGGGFSNAATASTRGGSSGTVNNVTNNFSAPPPDAHTFTKNLLFELNAA